MVFDFDGTIARTDLLIMEIYNKIAPELSLKQLTHEEINILRDLPTKQALQKLSIYWFKIPTLWQHITQGIAERIEEIDLQPGMTDLLLHLENRGYRYGIVSSNSVGNIKAVLKKHHMPEPIFIGSSSALFSKHKVYKKIAEAKGFDFSKSIYVGDETRDIKMGKKLGIPVVSVTWGYASRKSLMDAHALTICNTTLELQMVLDHFFHNALVRYQ